MEPAAPRLHAYARQPNKRIVAELLLDRQGGVCARSNPTMVCDNLLEVHHLDGNPSNWATPNLQLLCVGHHRQATNEQRSRQSVSVNEKTDADASIDTDATRELHRRIDYSGGSTEMQVTDEAEVPFRNWVIAKLRQTGRPIRYRELQDGGAEEVGVSIASTDRYLRKLTSSEGLLQTVKVRRGRVVWWRGQPIEPVETLAPEAISK